MFRNILVAIDGSTHSAKALAQATDLAQMANAKLAVIATVPDPSSWFIGGAYAGGVNFEALAEENEREYSKLLDDAVAALPKDISVTRILRHGRPAERILEQLHAGEHDLLVLGSRGRGEMRSLILGSVSHEVLNASPAAVLIVHADEPATDEPAD